MIVIVVLIVLAAVWWRRYEGDGDPNGSKKKTDGLLEKSETKHGNYSVVHVNDIW